MKAQIQATSKKPRRLSRKEQLDIATMRYFIPKTNKGWRISHADKVAMADFSGKGIKPSEQTRPVMGSKILSGLQALNLGKTMRDQQITAWRESIQDGIMTKGEIYDSCPDWMTDWLKNKLKDVPYDITGIAQRYSVALYREDNKL